MCLNLTQYNSDTSGSLRRMAMTNDEKRDLWTKKEAEDIAEQADPITKAKSVN